ncbi:MAG: T9SS type A sorting domain-containing protein [candidate division WOR-3 bacterium]
MQVVLAALIGTGILASRAFMAVSGYDITTSCNQLSFSHPPFLNPDSLNCHFVGNWPFGAPTALVTDSTRNIVFCGAGGGVYPIDVSNPTHPFILTDRLRTVGDVLNLYYNSDTLYIASYRNGFEVWDVTDPSAPNRLARFNIPGAVLDIAVRDSLAYLTCGDSGLRIFDLADLSHPREISHCLLPHAARFITLDWPYCYISGEFTMSIIDVGQPTNPHGVAACSTNYDPVRVRVLDSIAYLLCEHEMFLIDVSEPAHPVVVGYYQDPGIDDIYDLWVRDTLAYIASDDGVIVLNVTNPSNPHQIGICSTMASSIITMAGNHAFVAGNDFYVVDVTDPRNPVLIGTAPIPAGLTDDVFVSGNYAYIADCCDGLRIIDISNPTYPVEVGECSTRIWAQAVHVLGDYAYIADGRGLTIVNVTDPANPFIVGYCESLGMAHSLGLFVCDSIAYLADHGLWIINVTDPSNPTVIARYVSSPPSRDVCVNGNYAYLAADIDGLIIINISDPTHPVETGRYSFEGSAFAVSLAGSYACVAGPEGLMRVIDISDPTHPYEVGRISTRDHTPDVQVYGNYAYLAACYRIIVVDIADPTNPTEVGYYYPVPSPSYGITCAGTRIFVATLSTSLQIYESPFGGIEGNRPVFKSTKLNVTPNPSRSNVQIHLSPTLLNAQYVYIYDANGRLMHKLPSREVTIWNCRDNNGRLVPAGVYFICVNDKEQLLRSVVIMR